MVHCMVMHPAPTAPCRALTMSLLGTLFSAWPAVSSGGRHPESEDAIGTHLVAQTVQPSIGSRQVNAREVSLKLTQPSSSD